MKDCGFVAAGYTSIENHILDELGEDIDFLGYSFNFNIEDDNELYFLFKNLDNPKLHLVEQAEKSIVYENDCTYIDLEKLKKMGFLLTTTCNNRDTTIKKIIISKPRTDWYAITFDTTEMLVHKKGIVNIPRRTVVVTENVQILSTKGFILAKNIQVDDELCGVSSKINFPVVKLRKIDVPLCGMTFETDTDKGTGSFDVEEITIIC